MLSDKFIFRPSLLVGLFLAVGGGLSVAGALIIPIYAAARVLAVAVLVALFAFSVRRHALLRGGGAVRGVLFRRGEVSVLDGDGTTIDAGAVLSVFVSPLLSVAVIAGRRRRYALLLFPDSLPAEEYRRLRVRLNIAKSERQAERQAVSKNV